MNPPVRIAVVSDAISDDFFFELWHRYYGGQFGDENLFVITYAGMSRLFREFRLGGLIELPVGYDNTTRRDVITRFVSTLLACYDVVVRVDIDEFLVIDPRVCPSLAEFVREMPEAHMAARGFDVTQLLSEPALPEKPDFHILRDRSYAYPNTALNKTCIVKLPVFWSNGFHWANVKPEFGPLFMLHLKRLDIGWQMGLFSKMSENIRYNPKVNQIQRDRYLPDEGTITEYHKGVSERKRLVGIESWYREGLMQTFADNINLSKESGLYVGEYGHELVLCKIPDEWKAIL